MSKLVDDTESFLAQLTARGRSPKTINNYRHHLDVMLSELKRRGCRRSADVKPADLDAVMQRAHDDGRAAKSRRQCAVLIKQFFRWALEEGLIMKDPSRGLPLPDGGEEPLKEPPLSQGEVEAIFASLPRMTILNYRDRAMLELLYGAGLRIGEVCALNIDDIDLERGVVTVIESKGGQSRVVPAQGTCLSVVRDYLSQRRRLLKGPDHGALLLTERGGRLNPGSTYRFFDYLNARRGPDARHLHPHLFRHSVIVHLLMGGVPLPYLQRFLGHGNLNTIKTYLRLLPEDLREPYERAMPDIDLGLPPELRRRRFVARDDEQDEEPPEPTGIWQEP
jgi:site-specific recombinase XerD